MLAVFEGCDGVGKTSYIKRVSYILEDMYKRRVKVCSLPGNTPLGKQIRAALFDPEYGTKKMVRGVNTALFLADFIQTQSEIIKPALDAGYDVLCDRWFYSEYAYAATKLNDLGSLNKKDVDGVYEYIWKSYQVAECVKPSAVVFLKASKDVIAERLEKRGKSDKKQEGKVWGGSDFQMGIQSRYEEFFDCAGTRNLVPVDTSDDVHFACAQLIANKLSIL